MSDEDAESPVSTSMSVSKSQETSGEDNSSY